MRRKILLPAFFYASGILIFIKAQEIKGLSYYFLVGLIFLALFLFFKEIYSFSTKQILVLYLCFFIGIVNPLIYMNLFQAPFEGLYNDEHEYILKVLSSQTKDSEVKDKNAPYGDSYQKLEAKIIFIDGSKFRCCGKVTVNIYNETTLNLTGSYIKCKLSLEKPRENTNPHCFNYRKYLNSRGIFACASTYSFQLVKEGDSFKTKLLDKREGFIKKIDKNGAIIRGVCFGDKSEIDEESLKEFQRNGTAHVLAVSGLHIGVIYALIKRLLYKKNRMAFYLVLISTLGVYGIMTMWSVSVIRASLLIIVALLSFIFERRYDLTSGIVAVALIILIARPLEIMDVSFQMSFLAVLSLSFFAEKTKTLLMKKFSEEVSRTFSAVLAIQLGLGIFSAYTFNYFSIITFLVNIPVIFVVSYMVPFVFVQFVIYIVSGFVPLEKLSEAFCFVLTGINKMAYANGVFSINMVSKSSIVTGLVILLIFYMFSESFLVSLSRKEYKKVVLTILMIFLCSLPLFYNQDDRFNKADAIFVDVGQGDCLHIRDGGRNYLIDGGGNIRTNIGEKTLRPYLLKNGARRVDGAFATHNHTDHYLGLCQLSEELRIKESFISSGYLDNQIRCRKTHFINNDSRVKFSKRFWVEVLWPEPGAQLLSEEDENSVSLVLMVHLKEKKILITGDIDSECERMLVTKYGERLKCDVLKVAHHGSKYSTSEEFLRAANPEIAVISVGKNNYGHPSSEVIDKLKMQGIKVYRTDQNGAIGLDIKHLKLYNMAWRISNDQVT